MIDRWEDDGGCPIYETAVGDDACLGPGADEVDDDFEPASGEDED